MRGIVVLVLMLLFAAGANAKGLKGSAFTRSFTPEEYGAHIRNFDIVCDRQGNVYVANFEGLLIYDHARWRVYHTPDITRIVSLKLLDDDTVVAFDYTGKPFSLVDGSIQPRDGMPKASKEDMSTQTEAYDGRGGMWSITEDGLLYTAYQSPYSRFGREHGLQGEVLSLLVSGGTLYAGTSKGLFVFRDSLFTQVSGVNLACWQMAATDNNTFLAATATGVCRVTNGIPEQLTTENTLSVLPDGKGGFYAGELQRVRHYSPTLTPTLTCEIDHPSRIILQDNGTLWIVSIYGAIVCRPPDSDKFLQITGEGGMVESVGNILHIGGNIYIDCLADVRGWDPVHKNVDQIAMTKPDGKHFVTQFNYVDPKGISWTSYDDNKGVIAYKGRDMNETLSCWARPFRYLSIRAMVTCDEYIAVGGNFGIYTLDSDSIRNLTNKPKVFIRSFDLRDDDLEFTYSTDHESLPGKTRYHYRLNDDEWTPWNHDTEVKLPNIKPGHYTLQVMCEDEFGIDSETIDRDFDIPYPFYLRWYAVLFYILTILTLVYQIVKWRTERMLQENAKLEHLVEKRTAQLREAQSQLVRQEKLAMMGKLIQGLIDRILNPMNYILNFTKLTQGLGKDLTEDIQSEKDSMDSSNYDDSMEILQMIRENLVKIEEHSTSTTRILKAMEALLNEKTENRKPTDIVQMLRRQRALTEKYYAADIAQMAMHIDLRVPDTPVEANIDEEQMGRAVITLIANSIYALKKKCEKTEYEPRLVLGLELADAGKSILITVRDNGIGIEDSIKGKVFDPFFTTKPTSDATGVGLYMTREAVQNHGGEIHFESEKDRFTQFNIRLPRGV